MDKPWVSTALRESILKKNKLFSKYMKTRVLKIKQTIVDTTISLLVALDKSKMLITMKYLITKPYGSQICGSFRENDQSKI